MYQRIATLTVIGTLLAACAAPPARAPLAIEGLLRISHSSGQTAANWYQLGKYHQQRGQFDLAIEAYSAAIALDRRQLEPRNAQATVLALQGRLDEAQQTLLRLVADYPEVAHPYNNLGYVYLMQRDYAAAVAALKRALSLDAGDERARNNLATALAAAGQSVTTMPAPPVAARVTATIAAGSAAATTAALPLKPAARMELVRIEPHVYQLKLIAAAAEQPVLAPQPVAPTGPVKSPSAPLRVAIANGNGVTGMALQVRLLLARRGIAAGRLSNLRPYRQQQTEIEYPRGLEQQALALNDALQGLAVLVPVPQTPTGQDLRLVLGKDGALALALRAEFSHPLAAN
jgi:Tfp pilus assembly protein PilF